MNNVDVFSYENLTYQWNVTEEREEGNISSKSWQMRQMVNFHSVSHVPYSAPTILEFIGQKANFMASLN
jgi:hypothetical protein